VASSIRGRIAFGERAGQKVRYIGQAFGYEEEIPLAKGHLCYSQNGFSLHAATRIAPGDRHGLEKLIRYIAFSLRQLGRHAPVATHRLKKAEGGNLIYKLKSPWRNGTTHVLLSPQELLEKLTAVIPPPRAHMVKYSGVFAPHHRLRKQIILRPEEKKGFETKDPGSDRKNKTWAKLLARSFKIDLTVCPQCEGKLQMLGPVLDPIQVERYLRHLNLYHDPPEITAAHGSQGELAYEPC